MKTALPRHASVVVVGGGVMGCSTLYHLAKAGISDAILLERNELTSGTTWHSAAQVRALRSSRNMSELIRYSVGLYSELEAETGQATGWINKGSLSIATSPDRLTHIRRQADLAALFGIEAQTISPGEAKERWPLMNSEDVLGAVWSPGDGRVSPSDLCAALIKGARRRGATIFEQTSVTGIVTNGGRVRSIETSRGHIRCDALVLCTGLWSREAGAMAGRDIPLWPCEHFYLLTKPVPGADGNLPTLSDHDSHLYIRDDSGGLLVGCFEPEGKPISARQLGHNFAFRLLNEDWDHFEPMMANALHRLPVLEHAEIKTLLNGPESFTPDGQFYLGDVPETRGLYLGCGMNSVGVASAGGAGMALARMISTGQPPFDIGELHPGRLPEGVFSAEAVCARAPEVLGKHYEITYPGRQWQSARKLTKHPLHERFATAGAHFGQVYGWERPLFFGNASHEPLTFGRPPWFDQVAREVASAHDDCALFDLSTFGKIDIRGPDAAQFLERVCANRMDRPVDRAIYTQMLNDEAWIISDLVAVRHGEDHYRLSVGTNAVRRDLAWLQAHRDGARVEIENVTSQFATLGLMGAKSFEMLASLGVHDLLGIRYFHAAQTELASIPASGIRLSYIGEAGFEITTSVDNIQHLWDLLTEAGAKPAGLYAQTSMRIEKRFLSYGHDIDSDLTPLDAGLGFAVGWQTSFVGREALLRQREQKPVNRIVALVFDDETAVPIGDEPVAVNGNWVGKITSAAFGHRLGRPVAVAALDEGCARAAFERVDVRIAGKSFVASVHVDAPFDPDGTRMRSEAP